MPAFTTIALTTLSAAGSAFSFAEANKQNKLARDAQRDAANALEEAKKKLEVNYMRGLSIAKEPYELAREALLSQGAAALQAGVEGDPRGAAATAGRVMQAQQLAQGQQRASMSKEMQNLSLLAAQEDVNLQKEKASLDLAEATGQQMMATDARRAAAAATQAGVQGLVDMGTTLFQGSDLYAGQRTDAEKAAIKSGRQSKRLDRIEKNRGIDARNRVGARQFKRDTREMRRDNPDIYDLITDPSLIAAFSGINYRPLFDQ
tara:strand:- start:9332 stop:10114 length:783 start_codon:yes stop_codon:yes gene_type:complete